MNRLNYFDITRLGTQTKLSTLRGSTEISECEGNNE